MDSSASMPRALRALIATAGMMNLALTGALVLQARWAVDLWPWETGRLSHLFLASMFAAVGVAAVYVGLSGEGGSLRAGFGNLAITFGGMGGYLLIAVAEHRVLGAGLLAVGALNVVLWVLARRFPGRDGQPLPTVVRASYVVFTVVLLAVGVALVAGADVLPWPVEAPTSVLFGWIFIGDAYYFAHAATRPNWGSALAQLWSFLAYDAVLLLPLLAHLSTVQESLRTNLIIYIGVLAYSAALAVWYLLLHRPADRARTRRPRDRTDSSARRG